MTELEAGRELDELIASQVMTHPHARWRDPVPNYSTDIADAWTVVEKLGLAVFRVDKEWWQAGIPNGEVHFRRSATGHGEELFIEDFALLNPAVALTAPLAICRAALKAVSDPN